MIDNDNAKEIEAALHEDDEPVETDPKVLEEKRLIEEEALAEEEFVADQEDSVNPMFFERKEHEVEQQQAKSPEQNLDGAFGSGGLEEEEPIVPISNEEELRKESVNDDELNKTPINDDFGATDPIEAPSSDDSSFGVDDAALPVDEELDKLETEIAVDAQEAAAEADNVAFAEPEEAPAAEAEPIADPEPVPAPEATAPEATDVAEPAPEAAEAAPEVAEPAAEVPSMATAVATEPTPAAPAVGPTPIPAGMPTTSAPEAAPADAPVAGEKPKKKKTGLIVAIVIILVLLIGGALGFVLFYQQHEAPERQVSDAIENFLEAPILGTVSNAVTVAAGNTPSMSLDITTSELEDVTIKADVAFKDSSSIYFKLGGLDDVKNKVLEEASEEADDSEDMFASLMTGMIDGIFTSIDNKWITLDTKDLSGSDQAEYKCIAESFEAMTKVDYRKKLAELYRQNSFLTIKEGSEVETHDGVNYYTVEYNEEIGDKFGAAIEETDEYKKLVSCSDVAYEDDDDDWDWDDDNDYDFDWDDDEDYDFDWDDDDWDWEDDEDEDVVAEEKTTSVIKLGIKSWTHELEAIEVVSTTVSGSETTTSTVKASFGFVADSELEGAKTIEDIADDMTSAIQSGIEDLLKGVAEEGCKEYEEEGYLEYFGYESVEECVEASVEEMSEWFDFGDMNPIDMMGGLTLTSGVPSIEDFDLVNKL